jgi:hypothetical protein
MKTLSPLRIARMTAIGLAGLYILLCALGHLGYRRVLYPAPQREEPVPSGARLLELRAADGVPVHALEFANASATQTVVYFHGNGEIADDNVWMAHALVAKGFAVTLVEFRGYGRSRGVSPSEEGLYADATAVLDDLASRGVHRVVLWGTSLGSGVAAEMAHRGRGEALVLVTPYTSIPDMAARFVPFLPVHLLVGDKFNTLAKAPELHLPTVVVHGTDDELIPFAMGERLSKAIAGARFEPVEGGHHMDTFLVDRGLLARVVAVIAK